MLYLLLPLPLFLLGWFQMWLSAPLSLALIWAVWRYLWPLCRGPSSLGSGELLVTFLLALCWVMLSAGGGLMQTHDFADWVKHDAVFLDLVRHSWPVAFDSSDDRLELFRYYLGFYLPPAFAAKLLGIGALNLFIPVWMTLGVWLVLLLCIPRAGLRWALASSLILIAFSGMDILRVIAFEQPEALKLGKIQLEWNWQYSMKVQFPAHATAFNYVPQHLIPAMMATALLLRWNRLPQLPAVVGLMLVSIPLWSTFVALGFLPLLIVILWRTLRQGQSESFITPANLIAISALAPTLLYLFSGTVSFTQSWLWNLHTPAQLLLWLPSFYLFQFGALAAVLLGFWPQLRGEGMVLAALAGLLLLPLYSYGLYNDLAMRACMPLLMVLCFSALSAMAHPEAKPRARAALVSVLLIGACTAVFEAALSIRVSTPGWHDYRDSERSVKGDTAHFLINQYIVDPSDSALMILLREPVPGHTAP